MHDGGGDVGGSGQRPDDDVQNDDVASRAQRERRVGADHRQVPATREPWISYSVPWPSMEKWVLDALLDRMKLISEDVQHGVFRSQASASCLDPRCSARMK